MKHLLLNVFHYLEAFVRLVLAKEISEAFEKLEDQSDEGVFAYYGLDNLLGSLDLVESFHRLALHLLGNDVYCVRDVE